MAVLRAAGRCLLPLVIPASCVLWVLFFFPSPSPELAVRRESFQPTVTLPVQVRRDVGMSPPPPPPPRPPRGDSYTRRSVFDAILAGCVPVFFHPGSAYTQYRWHLPRDHTAYSVFVPEDGVRNGTVRLEDVLRRISAAKVAAMREQVIRMIPTVVYRDPRGPSSGVPRDAVDVAVDGMIERIRRIKRGLPPGGEDDGGEHRWDTYFDKQ
uniref:Exostosin GT47 domain-containing protein n=1 Tax=Oryza brachyantha TaxID=4533 RepID=J3NEC9_ORYBR